MKKALHCVLFLLFGMSFLLVDAQTPSLAPFYHGVASGDPLTNQVILWTRVTPPSGSTASIDVQWQIATDMLFTNIVNRGMQTTDGTKDFTVKVDVNGLSPATCYYYRFWANGQYSIIGRTKTTPSGNANNDNLRFAVVSCSNYEAGYFNAYQQIAQRNDIDAVIHLGDYIYEYGTGEFGTTRNHLPTNEIITLSDYRERHSFYKWDLDLIQAHQHYPWITTWDDHETANDSYEDGAQNHDSGEGSWMDRKSVGIQAYFEWMPLRMPDPTDDERIYRKIQYGNLADIFILDTRLEEREEQVNTVFDPNYNDPNRTILGSTQESWLLNCLSNSTAKWKVLAQQVMMAPLELFSTPINLDQWDGYPAERQAIFDHIMNNNIENIVVLTGDIHTSWANDLPYNNNYNPNTGANSVGVEFVTTSVTSPGFPINVGANVIQLGNRHIKYTDLTEHGYLILDLNAARAQGDWYFVPTVSSPAPSSAFNAGYYVNDTDRYLNTASGASVAQNTACAQATLTPPAPGVAVRIKVLLEAVYDNMTALMKTDLLMNTLLPLNQPFNMPPWNYAGTESISSISDFPANTVDWVLVELRDPNNVNTILASQAGFLLDDGTVVSIDANTNILSANAMVFNNIIPNQDFYITVRSRNHLATISANTVTVPNNNHYDFSTAITQAMGPIQLIEVAPGRYAQFAGDLDSDGLITVHDFNDYRNELSLTGMYLEGDLNMDGTVSVSDFNDYRPNASVIGISEVRY